MQPQVETVDAKINVQIMDKIDLRSDTVTIPTLEMRLAMANAIVGDDVYGEDPTINQLEIEAAQVFGKEAGLFIATGTQGNLLALLSHCVTGDTVLLGRDTHTLLYERGGVAAVAGLLPWFVPIQADGTMLESDIELALEKTTGGDGLHTANASLILVENTYNIGGGIPLSVEYMNKIGQIAKANKMKFHVDGARIFNAAAHFGIDVKTLTESADSITFCLSKGLCAPCGSVLVGSREFINKARCKRKMLGGGMRQAGVLAAAGLIALHKMSKRLEEDHKCAKLLADGLREIPGIKIESNNTNFVWFRLVESKIGGQELKNKLQQKGILVGAYGNKKDLFRVVTHYYIKPEMVETVVNEIKNILSQ